KVIHEFLYIPECPVPLLGRDLLSKLGAQVTFSPEERSTFQMDTMTYLLSLSIPPQDEWRLHDPPKEEPGLGGRQPPSPPRLAEHQAPVIIELKPGTIPVRKHQYLLPIGAWAGILPHINRLKQVGILVECQLVNQATVTLHPTVPNSYTLLSLLPPRTKVYTGLDLKDAFFYVRFTPASQPIFAFKWEDPVRGTKQQLIWTPPQGFKNSPAIFGEALASDLNSFHPEEYGCWLLQYG
ncbi:hypothetical protein M91_15078, partial [Bos mutus]